MSQVIICADSILYITKCMALSHYYISISLCSKFIVGCMSIFWCGSEQKCN